jgi:hypothetical protein
MPEPITKVKACDAMVVSLSGLVDDYNWQHDPASPVVCILTEDSYQDHFLVKKTELEKLQEKVAKLEEANAYANKVLKRSQFYAHMGGALHNEWFQKLPGRVKADLSSARIFNLPRLFTIWWLLWSYRKPECELPPILLRFPDYSIHNEDNDDLTPRLVDDNEETELGKTVTRAWNSIPSVDRNLMLFCWVAQQEQKVVRRGIAHPATLVAEAKALLREDLDGTLHTRAIAIVEDSNLFVR